VLKMWIVFNTVLNFFVGHLYDTKNQIVVLINSTISIKHIRSAT
jgi:hypothetical protein